MKTLSKQVESITVNYDASAGNWSIFQLGGDYVGTSLSANQVRILANKGYFDLSGLTQAEKTLFIENISLQLQAPVSGTLMLAGDAVQMITMLSDVPISEIDIGVGAGWAGSTMTLDNCIMRRTQTWATTVDAGSFGSFTQLVSEVVDGKMRATSSDRIYYAVYVSFIIKKTGSGETSPVTSVYIPGIRFMLEAEAREEPEFVYLMRQRRAYELQQEPDED